MNKSKEFKVLSIDAWRYDGGWNWNNWYNLPTTVPESIIDNNRKLLNYLRKHGVLGTGSIGKVAIEDDQYNKVIVAKGTREPLYAVEYGSEY